ncbi:hypothetical protein DFH29DRAFT_54927 [Suillus ampliporus]|nr:hypothetical protein DFH29DRAFT_54927 [Suillus ampliporus]
MFNANLQDTLARYSDPSRNPYAHHVFRSQTSESSSSQHLAQTPQPGLDASFGVSSVNQWRLSLKLDIEALQVEQPLQVLDSRGCYIQSPTLRTHTQPCAQQVLPEHTNFVTSSPHIDGESGAAPAPTHDAAIVIPKPSDISNVPRRLSSESNVPPRFWSKHQPDSESTDKITSAVPPPDSTVPPSASGSHVDPIITAGETDASSMSDISRPANMGNAMAKTEKGGTDKGDAERTEAARAETEKITETEKMETLETERMEIESRESATKEAEPKKEPRASTATNAPKLLRMERKLNNKDLFMGWYKSKSSSEIRYPRECIAPKIGDVYVHSSKKEGKQRFQLWVRQISRGMTIWVKAHIFHIHPKLLDRRLILATTGEPYWATRTSLMASGSRERAGKIAEMILYS